MKFIYLRLRSTLRTVTSPTRQSVKQITGTHPIPFCNISNIFQLTNEEGLGSIRPHVHLFRLAINSPSTQGWPTCPWRPSRRPFQEVDPVTKTTLTVTHSLFPLNLTCIHPFLVFFCSPLIPSFFFYKIRGTSPISLSFLPFFPAPFNFPTTTPSLPLKSTPPEGIQATSIEILTTTRKCINHHYSQISTPAASTDPGKVPDAAMARKGGRRPSNPTPELDPKAQIS